MTKPEPSAVRQTGSHRYEDDWVRRGDNVYTGKDYGAGGTEILTMGVERLHRDPLEFFVNDPECFEFVIRTLQKI